MDASSFDLASFVNTLVNDVFLYYGKLFADLAALLGLTVDPVVGLFGGLFVVFTICWFARRYLMFVFNVLAILTLIEIVRRFY